MFSLWPGDDGRARKLGAPEMEAQCTKCQYPATNLGVNKDVETQLERIPAAASSFERA